MNIISRQTEYTYSSPAGIVLCNSAHLWCPVKADAASRSSFIVIDVWRLQHSVDCQVVQGQLNTAGGVRPRVVDLYAPPLFSVHTQTLVITFLTCRT